MKFLLYRGMFFGFIFNILILLALGWTAYKRILIKNEIYRLEQHNSDILLGLESTMSALKGAQNMAKAYTLTQNEETFDTYYANVDEVKREANQLELLLKDDPIQRENVTELTALINRKIKYHTRLVELIQYKDFEAAKRSFAIEENLVLNHRLDKQANKIKDKEVLAFAEQKAIEEQKEGLLQTLFYILFAVSFCLLVFVLFAMRYHLKGRLRAETRLAGNEELIKSLIDRTNEPVFIKDMNGQYIMANKQFEDIFYRKTEPLKGKTDADLFPKELAAKLRSNDLEVIKAGKELRFEEEVPQDGKMHTYITVKFPLWDLKNKIYGIGGIATDITEHKELEAKLTESEDLVQTLFDIAPEALVMVDDENKIIKWNNKAEEVFKWEESEVLGKQLQETIIPQSRREIYLNRVKEFKDTGSSSLLDGPFETIVINKNNVEFEVEASVSFTLIEGKYIFVIFLRDISGRKKLERENQENKDFLASVFENIPDMLFVKDAKDLKFVIVNKASIKLLGWSKNELIGKTAFDIYPKEQAEFFSLKDREAIEKGEMVDIKEEQITTKYDKKWVHTKKIPIMDENGKPKYVLGISSDITKEKELEEQRNEASKKLIRSEKRMALILDNIGEGVIVKDNTENAILLNGMAEEIFRFKDETSSIIWSNQYDIFYPDGKKVFPAQNLPLERALKGESTDETEIVMKDRETGEVLKLKVNGRPILDEKNRVLAAVATVRDITKFKEIEEALEESELKYRNLIGFKRENGDGEEKKTEEPKPTEDQK